MAAAIAAHPGLTVTEPAAVSIGGLTGVMIDISMASDWTGTCPFLPEVPWVPLLVGSGPSSGLQQGIRASNTTRLYLLDSDKGVVTIEAVDQDRARRFDVPARARDRDDRGGRARGTSPVGCAAVSVVLPDQ